MGGIRPLLKGNTPQQNKQGLIFLGVNIVPAQSRASSLRKFSCASSLRKISASGLCARSLGNFVGASSRRKFLSASSQCKSLCASSQTFCMWKFSLQMSACSLLSAGSSAASILTRASVPRAAFPLNNCDWAHSVYYLCAENLRFFS